jgi:tetratricopeptide (TPR) repeat protein
MKWQLTLLFFLFSMMLFSQTKLDTLWHNLKAARHDTAVYNAYMELGNYFQNSNPDTSIYFHTQAEKVAEKIPGAEGELRKGEAIHQKGWDNYFLSNYEKALINYKNAMKVANKYSEDKDKNNLYKAKKLLAACFSGIGSIYLVQGNYDKALKYYSTAHKLDKKIGNKQGESVNLGNIAIIYHELGNYAKALEYYFKALKIDEELGNINDIAKDLSNIGIVYHDQGNYIKALEYYLNSLKLNKEKLNKVILAANYGNIGIIYQDQGKYPEALEYYFKALQINKEIGDIKNIAITLGNIGSIYKEQCIYSKALDYYFKALQISEDIMDMNTKAINLENIGEIFIKLKKYAKAEEYLKKAEKLQKELGILFYLQNTLLSLSLLAVHDITRDKSPAISL